MGRYVRWYKGVIMRRREQAITERQLEYIESLTQQLEIGNNADDGIKYVLSKIPTNGKLGGPSKEDGSKVIEKLLLLALKEKRHVSKSVEKR